MQMSTSSYYDSLKRSRKLISTETLKLYRLMKALFVGSRGNLGGREMIKN